MSPASAALPKDVPTNGRRSTRRKDSIVRCPEADLLIDFLRTDLLAMKDRLGWTYQTLAAKMGTVGRDTQRYRNWRSLEVMLKTGGFPTMVKIAKAMGLRVTVDLK